MRRWNILGVVGVLLLGGAAAFPVLAWRSEIAPVEAPKNFDAALVQRGAELASVGNCIACHTMPGKKAFAGGLPLSTPFGTIHSTNITPDSETGIGKWSVAAFQRAMREGVDREGEYLYPVFPYDHFTHVTDADNQALYAYLMTREPVKAKTPHNHLTFPLGFRPLVAIWNLLYLDEGPFQSDPGQSEDWNRGAYLAEGLGHCGGCHTPRKRFGAEDKKRHFAGGEAEGWIAYAINASSPAPTPWDKEALAFFLRHGWHEKHGVSHGPMAEVTSNLAGLPEKDIDAIAAYVASEMGEPEARREAAQKPSTVMFADAARNNEAQGAAVYQATCAMCHESGRPPPFGGLDFRSSTAINAPNPQNIINVTLFGIPPADGEASAVMPAFAATLSDQQIANLLAYMRRHFSGKPVWDGVAEMVRKTRSGEPKAAVRSAASIERTPENLGGKE